MIVPKEDCFVEYTKPPVVRKAKPGVQAQYIISLIETRNPNPSLMGKKFGFFVYGGPEETRTLDLSDANRTLSQLSYRPENMNIIAMNRGFVKAFF